jgi:protein SCO1
MKTIDSQVQPSTPRRTGRPAIKPHIIVLWVTAVIAGVIAGTLIVRATRPPELHGTLFQPPIDTPDFTLNATTGGPLSLSDLRGKYVLLYFGYTFCPDVCPTTLNELAVMMDTLDPDKAKDVQVVMVTVDPERDTVEHLAEYLKYFDPSFVGLTGTLDEIQTVASEHGVFFEKRTGTEDSGYLVDHTSYVNVIDPDGKLRMIFPYGTTGADMAADLKYVMR